MNSLDLKIDLTLLEKSFEPPFFYTICSNRDFVLPKSGMLYPFMFNRIEYSRYLAKMSIDQKQQVAAEIIIPLFREFVNNRNFDAILPFLGRFLKEIPPNPELNYLYAFCLHSTNKELDKAMNYYNQALDQGFDEFWVRYNRGCLHVALGNKELARIELEKAFTLKPDFKEIQDILDSLNVS